MLTLLRPNVIVNLCWEAWPQLHLIDTFVMWMWYLCREWCLLLAPLAAILSLHLSQPPLLNRLPSNALIPRGSQLADQNNYRRYGHVYVCIWIITVVPPLRERTRVKRVIRTSTYPVCSLRQTARVHIQEAHTQRHTREGVCAHWGPSCNIREWCRASHWEATNGLLVMTECKVAFPSLG